MESETAILDSLPELGKLCPTGYAMALHISFSTPRFLFQTYSHEWMDVYSRKGFVLQDPTVIWGFTNTGTKNWTELANLDDAGILKEAENFGIHFGFTVSVDEGDSKSIGSFTRGDREFTKDEVSQIEAVFHSIHLRTADIQQIPAKEVEQLKRISVNFTHR